MRLPDIGKRLLFAIPAVPVAWWLINSTVSLVPQTVGVVYPGQLLAVLLAFLACFEYIGMLRPLYPHNWFWISYVWLAGQFMLYLTDNQPDNHLGMYVLVILVALEAFLGGHYNRRRRWVRASLLFSGVAFLYMCAISLLNFWREPFQQMFVPNGHALLSQLGICLVVLSVALCDSFAYFVGCAVGKHHFSTISPNKTIEGAAGGFCAAVITASVGWWFLADPHLPNELGILLGVLIGVFAQVGDLFVSLMKRYFRVKDSSRIIPGHGGILDRFGSLFFTAPAVAIFTWVVNRIF